MAKLTHLGFHKVALWLFAVTLPTGSLFAADATFAPEVEALLRKGNNAFDSESYPAAIASYAKAVDSGFLSPDVFILLGNAHYRAGSDGMAALWWRRAQIADPLLAEARQNLRFLEIKIAPVRFESDTLGAVTGALPGSFWLVAGVGGGWLLLIGIAALSLRPTRKGWRLCAHLCCWFGIVFGALGASGYLIKKYREIPHIQNLAVVTGLTTARTDATDDSSPVIELPAGSEVSILGESGPWTYVGIPGNLRGWVRTNSATRLWPFDPGYLQ